MKRTFTGSHLRVVTDADDDDARRHSTTTRATYRQQDTNAVTDVELSAGGEGDEVKGTTTPLESLPAIGEARIRLRLTSN